MISQDIRAIAPEMDPLRMGMGWTWEDLGKPQIMIESTFGDSHPGSAHLLKFVNEAADAIYEAGGKASRFFTTDICDGMSQGHDGINYSLASREMIANMIEIHAMATPFDAGVFIASCDKGMPAHLKAIGRLNMPSIMVTGGVKPTRENLEGWFKAGVTCVGMGSNLFPKEVIAAGEWDKISDLCRNALDIIKSVR